VDKSLLWSWATSDVGNHEMCACFPRNDPKTIRGCAMRGPSGHVAELRIAIQQRREKDAKCDMAWCGPGTGHPKSNQHVNAVGGSLRDGHRLPKILDSLTFAEGEGFVPGSVEAGPTAAVVRDRGHCAGRLQLYEKLVATKPTLSTGNKAIRTIHGVGPLTA